MFGQLKKAFGVYDIGVLEGDRETPIDIWMGWNTNKDDGLNSVVGSIGECILLEEGCEPYPVDWRDICAAALFM